MLLPRAQFPRRSDARRSSRLICETFRASLQQRIGNFRRAEASVPQDRGGLSVRTLVTAAVLSVVCAPAAFADIRLDTPQDLANLRATNFDHYQRAARIIAAANTLCRPGLPKLEVAKFGATDLS